MNDPVPTPDAAVPLLRVEHVSMAWSGVPVLDGVSFDVRAGEVHTLMGENGAGKSTLLKILAGVHAPDAGTLRLAGQPVRPASPQEAQRLGIALIHQEPLGFPDLTVAENVVLSSTDTPRGPLGNIDWTTAHRRTRDMLGALGVDIPTRARLGSLGVADRQMVELATMLAQHARVVLLDEPTASLTPREVARLFTIVRNLRAAGVAVLFISHRLPEVFEISDRITVLRDGRCIGTEAAGATTPEQVIQMMVGRPLSAMYERADVAPGRVLLAVRDLGRRGKFAGVSFEVRAGEIVGMAGLVGAGRTDVARAIFGAAPADVGTIAIDGVDLRITTPRGAVRNGIAYVPEDRQHHGLHLGMSIAANGSIAHLKSVATAGWISRRRERTLAEEWRGKLQVRLRDVRQPVRELSGGNQQKVVVAKWLATAPRVLIVDEPTRGVDVGAKAEIHHLMAELARDGKAILMISSDLPELLAMSDRVLVMREGRLSARFARGATQEQVMAAATGQAAAEGAVQVKAVPGRWARWLERRELGVGAFLLLAFAVCAAVEPRLFSLSSWRDIALYVPLIIVVAMGQMMVIVSRKIDLSVGSTLAMSAIVVGNLYIAYPGMAVGAALLVATGVGALLGLVNGVLIALLRVPAIIATLGTLTAYRGLVFVYSGGRQVNNNDLPESLIRLSQTSPIGIPWIVIFAAIIALATAAWLRYSRTGREIYAIGSDPNAAALRGVPVARVLLLIFTLTGALAGAAGLMWASRYGFINPSDTGVQMELVTISAVVIGGTAVFGGAGSVLGVLLGCVLLGLINVALPMMRVSPFWQQAIYGTTILIAAAGDTLIRRLSRRGEGSA